jgi:hypothetical protein
MSTNHKDNQDFGSEDDEDDFNPAPQEESDAEEPRAKVGPENFAGSALTRYCK